MNEGFFALTVIAWFAYMASRVVRRQVPELVVFLVVGAVLGPSVLGLLDADSLSRLQPLVEGALAVLMFVIGERISVRALRRTRWIITSGVLQYALTGIVVYFVSLQLGAGRPTALLLASIAGAGAPMTVASVVASHRARGPYPDGLIGTHALSDGLAATAFAAVLPIAELLAGGGNVGNAATRFLRLGVGGVALGLALGWFVARLGQQIETSGELLLFVLVHLLVAQTISSTLGLSLPLAAIVMGATTGTLAPSDHSQRVFVVVRTIEQPLYLLFFALAGASIHLDQIPEIGTLGGAYIGIRLGGKLIGGSVGGLLGGLSWRRAVRLGTDLVPQAGVAVGLAVLASETLPGPGNDVATIVLGSVVVFELAGSLLVARGLASDATSEAVLPTESHPMSGTPPTRILVAARSRLQIPAWFLDAAARWGADLVALGRGKEDDEPVHELREAAKERSLTFRWIPLRAESLTGAVTRTAEEIGADLVVVLTPETHLGFESRLVLLPHERIARRLSVPVLFLPAGAPPASRLDSG